MKSDEETDPAAKFEHVYAIVRCDEFLRPEVALSNRITIKKIVWTEAEARSEVARLNQLNATKGCVYFWQTTRLQRQTGLIHQVEDSRKAV